MANVFGTNGKDTIKPKDSNDVIRALGGDDKVSTGGGIDYVDAGNGDDLVVLNSGVNVVEGGAGADEFKFKENSSGVAVLADFEDGVDTINLVGLGVTDISELNMQTTDAGVTLIEIAGIVIVVNTDISNLSNADFKLADPPAANPISFEQLDVFPGNSQEIGKGFKGFNWINFYVVETDEYLQNFPESGYVAYRGDNAAFNGFDEPAKINRDTAFDLESAYMTAAWNNQLEVTVKGYLDGNLVGKQDFKLSQGFIKKILFDDAIFDQVDKVVFTATGGVDANDSDGGTGMNLVIDDILLI